jgi:TolB-like protein
MGHVPDEIAVGEILAEELIRDLSRSPEINVISRLSTTALSARNFTVSEIGTYLHADYVLAGAFHLTGDNVTVDVELSAARSGTIIWTERISDSLDSLLVDNSEILQRIVVEVSAAIVFRELRKSRHQPLPTLRSYTLLLSAIALMHRLSPKDYQEARRLLEEIISRSRRQAVPLAWLGNWHVLKVIQGWSENLRKDTDEALFNTAQALDTDPECSLALAIDGYVHAHLLKQFDTASERYDAAIKANPSNAMALMLNGTMHAMTDRGELAVHFTEKAMRLSPLDPHRFMYETHCAGAHLTAGNYERALELAERARRANRSHASALRIGAVALWELGRHDEARQTVKEVLKLEPNLTTHGYLNRAPSSNYKIGKKVAQILREAGVPA